MNYFAKAVRGSLLILILTGTLVYSSPVGAQSVAWYNSAWGYRNAITVTNGSGGALTNFQINVQLSSGFPFSNANANGSDVLFTASDGVTLIPFWLETWNPGQSAASLWVNVPSIPTTGTTIYMYYGNPSASSLSSGTATFNFFDDFSESTVDTTRWTSYGGTWTIVTDTQQDGTTGGVLSGTTTARQVLESSYTGTNYVLEAYGKQMSGRVWGVGTRVNTNNNLYSANLYDDLNSTNNLYLYRWSNSSATTLGDAAVGTVSANTWYRLMMKVNGNSINVYKDGVLEVQGTDSNLATGGVALYGESGTVVEFNNVFVRQYASVEPTLSIGSSTTQGTGVAVSSVAVSPTTVLGGVSSQGTVTLSAAAPAGGAVVTLTSSNTAVATVPASITIAAGSTTGTFSVTTTSVSAATSVTITASNSSSSVNAALSVNPLLTSVGLNPPSVLSGSSSQGTVTLFSGAPTGGAVVTLTSSNTAVATVPASITIAAGSTTGTFSVATAGVSVATNVTITASYGGATQTATLTVSPLLASVSVSPATVVAGVSSMGTVTLAAAAPAGGISVTLSSSNSTVASVPASVTVAAGNSSGTFTVTTNTVTTTTAVTLSASYGSGVQTTTVTVTPALSSLTLSPTTLTGGTSSQGTVSLAGAAPTGGAVVTLTSSNSAVATVPASVTVAAGSSSATFSINTTGVSSTTAVTITASYGNASPTASLTVQAGSSSGAWYNSAWGYRNAITVTNGSGGALTNFQINVQLSSGFPFSNANANGSDVLFTASDGVTLIPFWLETWNPGQSAASLWVNVPSIPTTGTTIYMYYGNPSASSLSSGTATFNFFDDFSESTVDTTRWTSYGGTWTIVTDTQQDGTTGGVLSGTTTARQVLESSYTGTNYVLEAYGKQMSGRVWGVGTRVNTNNNLYSANLYDDLNSTNNLYLYRWSNSSATTLGDAAVGTVSANTWYRLMMKVNGNSINVYKDGVLEVQGTDSNLATGGVALYGESGTVVEFNNVFVRQYASVEPTLSIGSSTTQGTGVAVSSVAVSPTTVLGGVSSQGTVTLSAAAPAGGAVVTLTSSNTAVATVPASITIAAGSTTGTFSVTTTSVSAATSVTITATYSGSSQAAGLTVQYLESIAVAPSNFTLNAESSQQYTATGTLGNSTTSNLSSLVTWSTSNSSVATISASGLLTSASVGTATVTATYGSVSGSTQVTVGQAVLQSIALSPSTASLGVGGTQVFVATGTYSDGSTQNLTSTATWGSSNTAVATVTSSGVAAGVTPGAVIITAMSGTISGTAALSVIPAVLTYHYDSTRAGVNTYETMLTTSNVNSTTFGKKFTLPVVGAVYAQPLYVPNVAIPGMGTHNVLYVATANDSLYAFDADSNTGDNAAPLWQVSMIDMAHGAASRATVVYSSDLGCPDISPTYGITSTPVIDLTTGTIYLVANSIENGENIYRLHALDITSGAEKSGSPVVITASVTGTGDGSVAGILTFDPTHHLNRAALLLTGGNVYIGFGSHCDSSPWHGWLFSYNGASLAQNGVFVTTPNGGMGGIWMSGSGVAADASGNLYLATGNGTFDTTNVPATELGDSIIKLKASNLALLDYFTPYNQLNMDNGDLDLGSGGVLLLGNQGGSYPNLLLESGKTGSLYLINSAQMTAGNSHYCSVSCGNTDPEIVQEVQNTNNGMWSSLSYWNNNVYLWGAGEGSSVDYLKAFSLTNGVLSTAPTSKSANTIGFPGATPVVSSNGSTNGIVWAIDSSQNGTDGASSGAAVLHAYNATNLSQEFYNSTQAAGNRDQAGDAVKFTVPVVINGKVYVGTSSEVDVYGPLP